MEPVTVGIVNYNGLDTLPKTLESVRDLNYPAYQVILVDNASTDGSREWVQEHYPEVRCICLRRNEGLPYGRNIILKEACTRYVLLIDDDIVLDSDCLPPLLRVMQSVPKTAVCQPEMRDTGYPGPETEYNGGWVHFLCTLVPRSEVPAPGTEYEVFGTVPGAAVLVDRNVIQEIGGFDGDLFFNWEDTECMSRVTLAGYLCLHVPGARVYHDREFRARAKVFYMTRNRWVFILKLYSWRTLALTAPALLVYEAAQALFLLMKGRWGEYWSGNLAAVRQLPSILKKRRDFQRMKVMRDRDWLRAGYIRIPDEFRNPRISWLMRKAYAWFFNPYWRAVRRFC